PLAVLGYAWPGYRRLFDGQVIGVQRRIEQHNGSDATRHMGHLACLVSSERPAQQRVLAIAEPLLDDLIAANSILPDAGRYIAPVGCVVQVNIAGRCTQTDAGLLFR